MAKEMTANYKRQNSIFWGTFVKAIGKENAYEVMLSETKSHSWSKLPEPKRELVLKALSKKTGIDITPRSDGKKSEPTASQQPEVPTNVIEFPSRAATTPRAPISKDLLSTEQLVTIGKLRIYLSWEIGQLQGFCAKRFDGKMSHELAPGAAHRLIFLLLHIAANKLRKANPDVPEMTENDWIEGIKEDIGIKSYGRQTKTN